jgi:hypothetical protein
MAVADPVARDRRFADRAPCVVEAHHPNRFLSIWK